MDELTDEQIQAQIMDGANARMAAEKQQAHPMGEGPISPLQAAQQPIPKGVDRASFLDSMFAHVDNFASTYGATLTGQDMRLQRAVGSGLVKGVVNAADSVKSLIHAAGEGEPADVKASEDAQPDPWTPMYEHARKAAMDFRDTIALKDPTIPESLVEGAAQLMPSFLMFSRVTGSIGGLAELWKGEAAGAGVLGAVKKGVGGLARFAAADTPNSLIMQGPHDARLADTLNLLRTAEGHFTGLLGKIDDGTGHLLSHYIDFITSGAKPGETPEQRATHEGEAEGRWKNVLDSYGAAGALTGLLHSAGMIFKQGWRGLHFMADNGMGSMSDIPTPQSQRGAIGDDLGRTPAGITQRYAQQIENNASGESAASLEAQNWVRAQKAADVRRIRLDPDGQPQELPGIEGRDPRTMTGQPVIELHKDGTHEIVDRGNLTKLAAEGLVARFKARNSIGSEEK